jgi:hypothetical protein
MPEVDLDGNNGPLIAAGGGLLLFISEFLDWFDILGSAWEFMDIVDVVLALLALIAIGVGAMLATGNTAINLPSSPSTIVTTSGIIAFSVVATFILEGDDQKFGVFLALIGTIGMIVGGMQLASGAAPVRRTPEPPTAPPPPPPPASPTV